MTGLTERGRLDVAPPDAVTEHTRTASEYAGLTRLVQAARLLERRPLRYAPRAVAALAFFGGCWWLVAVTDSWWPLLGVAALLGVASTQLAFLGHDGGHRQVTASRRVSSTWGLVCANALSGLSIGWWVDKHNRHHANPNKEGHDPDIGEGVLAFTAAQAARRQGRLAQAVVRHQAVLFFPLLTLEAVNLHVASVAFVIRAWRHSRRRSEAVVLGVHVCAYLTAVLWLLTPWHALAFVAVHQAVFGLYLGCSFAPNHKGMPVFDAHEKVDYLRRQVLTSRNVRGSWFVDLLLGGLNYQIEHHLFPSMPRANLRRAQPIVRDYCRQRQIRYCEVELFTSYAIVLTHLHEVSTHTGTGNDAV